MPRPNITEEVLASICEAASAVSRACGVETPNQREARFADLQTLLTKLRSVHGEHPLLLEVEADFTLAPADAVAMYQRAEQAALRHHRPTMSIRLSLARLLLKEMDNPAAAKEVLLACADELPFSAEKLCETWTELITRCEG